MRDLLSMGIQIAHDQAVRDEAVYQELEAKRVEKRKDLVWNLAAKPAFIIGGGYAFYLLVRLMVWVTSIARIPESATNLNTGIILIGAVVVWLAIIAVGLLWLAASLFSFLSGEDDKNPYNREFWLKMRNKSKKVNKYKELKATREKRLADIALYERYMNDPDFRRAYHEVMED